jgi:hypothetical protein
MDMVTMKSGNIDYRVSMSGEGASVEVFLDGTCYNLDANAPGELTMDVNGHDNMTEVWIDLDAMRLLIEIQARHIEWYRAWNLAEFGEHSPFYEAA